jgi:ArsR family transcriptional regulator, arsenate/arsenite/antimonite-responsive transcriptional repressor
MNNSISTAIEACCCDPGAATVDLPEPDPAAEAATDTAFKALASGPRRRLLHIIAAHTSSDDACCAAEVCACRLADALELAPSTISHHMAALTKAGLVTATRRGLWVYYRLERETLARVAGELVSL